MPTASISINHNNNNNNNEEQYATGDNRVIEPKEVDVLCGRGGMSNHHPGNEWYRRLIRSNRPLYRACPKHTKLLVSKAIVQAVEQQGGRFLERCARKSGFWYPVPYKRAVDKTSQGLRERDREDGGGDDDDGDDDEGAASNTYVPDSLRGNSNAPPNLVDLADVAIAHANASRGAEGLQPHPQPPRRQSLGGSSKNKSPAMKKQAAAAVPARRNSKTGSSKTSSNSNNKKAASTTARATASAAVTAASATTANNKHRSSWPPMPPPPPPGVTSMPVPLPRQPEMNTQSSTAAAAAAAASADDEDMAPLPPTLEQRQSSIFRLFQTAKLLPNQSTALNSELWSQSSTTPLAAAVTNNDSSDGSVPPMTSSSRNNNNNNFNSNSGAGRNNGGGVATSYSPARFGNAAMNTNNPYSNMNNIMGAAPGQSGSMMYAPNPAAAAALYEYASQQYPRGGGPPPPYLAAGLSALVGGVNPPFSNGGPSLSPPNNSNGGNINNNGSGVDAAPALTRLTSQVSDWLYSFWPVASRVDSVAGPAPGGAGGSPMKNQMGRQQQQQQKRPDPLGADGDSDEDKRPVLPNRQGAAETDPLSSNKRKSIGPYSDMVNGQGLDNNSQNQSQARRGSMSAKQERELERDARKKFALAPPIVTVPPPRPSGPVLINTIPPLQKGADEQQLQMNDHRRQQQPLHELQQQQQYQQYQEQQRRYSQEPPRKRNKRKSSANMPELPYEHRQSLLSGVPGGNMSSDASSSMAAVGGSIQGGMNPRQGGANGNMDDNNMDEAAPPTELEQSVSATLLKLAGSPSKHLLSGFTRFFETGQASIGAPLRPAARGMSLDSEAYFLRAMAEAAGPQSAMAAAAPAQMMSSFGGGGGGSYYGAPPLMANDFRAHPAGAVRGPSLYGNKRSEGDLLEDE